MHWLGEVTFEVTFVCISNELLRLMQEKNYEDFHLNKIWIKIVRGDTEHTYARG
jgi:hypothetical protein